MAGRQRLFDDPIDKGALRRCDPDPVLVRTVEEATERPASGIGFARGSTAGLDSATVRTPCSSASLADFRGCHAAAFLVCPLMCKNLGVPLLADSPWQAYGQSR